jgi:hypothetical protein
MTRIIPTQSRQDTKPQKGAKKQKVLEDKQVTYYRCKIVFKYTLAAPQIRNRVPRQALQLLEMPANVIPFPELGVLQAHAQIEVAQFDAADQVLSSIDPRLDSKVGVTVDEAGEGSG